MSLHAMGFVNRKNCDIPEWFPEFNAFFINKYLANHFNVNLIEFADNEYWRAVNYPHDYKAHINTITYVHPKSSKAIIFTTYYNTGEVFKYSKGIIDNYDTVIYSGHYNPKLLEAEWPGDPNIITPWLFRPLRWEEPEYNYTPKHDRLYFRGLTNEWFRREVNFLEQTKHKEIDVVSGRSKNYDQECCESKICLSLQGVRDMCNRDIELWSRGIPSIRPRFTCKLAVDIPEDIYIPIDFEYQDTPIGRVPANPEAFAKNIVSTYFNVKDDDKLLQQISNNSREFYLQNFTPSKIAEFTLNKILAHFDV